MSVTKQTIDSIVSNDRATKLLNQLNEVCIQYNKLSSQPIQIEDIVPKSVEEIALIHALRKKQVEQKKKQIQKFHEKILQSNFYN